MMVCPMCDPEGNPCDRCKMIDAGDFIDYEEEKFVLSRTNDCSQSNTKEKNE